MGIAEILDTLKKEVSILRGNDTRDTYFSKENTYADQAQAALAYEKAKNKLFDINKWSDLQGLQSSTFELYDQNGKRSYATMPVEGDYIRILLPGPLPENWVVIADIHIEPKRTEFTVFACEDPQSPGEKDVEHFFSRGASSTFRVELKGNTIVGSVIGKNEGINNEGTDAGSRALINTLVAEGGWLYFQQQQWEKLASYLVHLEEAKSDS